MRLMQVLNICNFGLSWPNSFFCTFSHSCTAALAMTTNYTCNEWLDEADLRKFERMKKEKPFSTVIEVSFNVSSSPRK